MTLVLMASILAGIEQSGAGASSLEQPLTVAEPAYTRSVLLGVRRARGIAESGYYHRPG